MSIFKKGDKVYHHEYGWGVFENTVQFDPMLFKQCVVVFDTMPEISIPYGYSVVEESELSFTEYELKGFSQERPIDYNDYIGCWGRFWDNGRHKIEGVLSVIDFDEGNVTFYREEIPWKYENFEPYPAEVLTALGLTNKKD